MVLMKFLVVCTLAFSVNVSAQDVLRILPLGNSITHGYIEGSQLDANKVGYRLELYNQLNSHDYNFSFIGHDSSGWNYLPSSYNKTCGIPSITTAQLSELIRTGIKKLPLPVQTITSGPYLDTYSPDIILLHIGTNDTWANKPAIQVKDSIVNILNQIDKYENSSGNPVLVLLSENIGFLNSDYTHNNIIDELNSMLAMVVLNRKSNGDKIELVDMNAGAGIIYTTGGDMKDLVHPNQLGYNKMGLKWFQALDAINNKPVISAIPTQGTLKGTPVSFNLDDYVADVETAAGDLTWSFMPTNPTNFNISIVNHTVTATPKNAGWIGSENITFIVKDNGKYIPKLWKSDTVQVTFIVNQPPIISGNSNLTFIEDATFTLTLNHIIFSDPDNLPGDWTLKVVDGINYTHIGNTIIPTKNFNGTLNVKLVVKDLFSQSSVYTMPISITPVNDAPEYTFIGSFSGIQDQLYTLKVIPVDPENSPVSLTVLNQPDWLSFNSSTKTFQGTPGNDLVGTHSISLRISDGVLQRDSIVKITILNVNDAPEFISTPSTVVYINTVYSYKIIVIDPDPSDLVLITFPVKPNWLNFNSTTNTLEGIAPNGQGLFSVTVQASDGMIQVLQNFTIKVSENHAPEITSLPKITVLEDVNYTYGILAIDADSDSLFYFSEILPSWLTFVSSTGVLIGKPKNNEVGNYSIKLGVSDYKDTTYQEFNIEVINVNDPPVIIGFSSYKTKISTPVQLKFRDLMVEDVDNVYPDDFTMVIMQGTNYTIQDYLITPLPDFLGILNVPIYVNDGNANSNTVYLTIEVVYTGIYDNKKLQLFIYPNPTSNILTISNLSEIQEGSSILIQIFDSYGRQVKNLQGFYFASPEIQMDLNDLGSGQYLILVTAENKAWSQKFIISK